MPGEKNKVARIVVPLVVAAVAIVVVIAVGMNTARTTPAPVANQPQQNGQTPSAEPESASIEDDAPANVVAATDEPDVEQPALEDVELAEMAELTAFEAIRARVVGDSAPFDSIGSLSPDSNLTMEIAFAPAGAGIASITLADYYTDIDETEHYAVQRARSYATAAGPSVSVLSLAARAVLINGSLVDLYSTTRGPIWRQTAPGAFEATIETEDGDAIARIEKQYILQPDSYDIHVQQQLVNLTDGPMQIEWIQYGPVDLPADELGYGGDPRRVRFGYLLNQKQDPSQQLVQTERTIHRRSSIIDSPEDEFGRIWPTDASQRDGLTLSWAAMTNRYFTFVVHPTIAPDVAASGQPVNKALTLASGRVDRVVVGGVSQTGADDRAVVMQLRSALLDVAPGESIDLDISAYTGPKWRKTLGADPVYTTLGMNKLVVFNFGGPCAFCTFQPLARGLLYFLGFFHDIIFHDWALAIMFLVVCVRAVLHPVTKKSQISVQRFSKQMQNLAPKQKKLQEKYKDDPKKMKEEMAKLMREEGVNFTGALGCLPMFLQSPIWIALYAMLFFAFDLRQQPAFFGVFQKISGGSWGFLDDLSAPDAFIQFGAGFDVPLMGHISSLNLLPLLLGVVFYAHQKYMTPPPSASMSPEQETQQKIMRVMMVVIFPLFMYNAPSGLALYFITNSTLGIFESRYIRAHIDKIDLEPKKPSPGRKRVENVKQSSPMGGKQRKSPSYKQRKK